MHFGQVINATPHPLDVYDESGREVVLVLEPSDVLARAGERSVRLSDTEIDGITIPITGPPTGRSRGYRTRDPASSMWSRCRLRSQRPSELTCWSAVRPSGTKRTG